LEIWDLGFEDLGFGVWDWGFEIWDLGFGICGLLFVNIKSEIKNLKFFFSLIYNSTL
jgi:hypothetical protein